MSAVMLPGSLSETGPSKTMDEIAWKLASPALVVSVMKMLAAYVAALIACIWRTSHMASRRRNGIIEVSAVSSALNVHTVCGSSESDCHTAALAASALRPCSVCKNVAMVVSGDMMLASAPVSSGTPRVEPVIESGHT